MSTEIQLKVPDHNFRIDSTQDLTRFLDEVLKPTLELLCAEAERWKRQIDPDTADENTVDAMLRDLGNPFEVAFGQSLDRRRQLVRLLVPIYKAKGSADALQDVVRTITGISATVVFPATILSWDLGVDVIGDTPADPPVPPNPNFTDFAFLGSSPDFTFYSFQIEVDRILTPEEREIVTEIVKLVKPAHTHFVGFLEPGVLDPVDHWELGVSSLHDGISPLLGDEIDLHD